MTGLTGDILVTGGAGFLARALYRRAREEDWDCRFTALSRDEAKHAELQHRYPEIRSVLCDVAGDDFILAAALAGHETVIHAAASKYVDRAELNAWDTVRTNIYGSHAVAEAAMSVGVERVIGISTDKACEPVNVYGLTKAVMERVFQEADRLSATRFTVVRYGNVVGSTGSVVPLFRGRLDAGEKIRLTNPRMTRFWMGVEEAIDLIVDALADASGYPGHVFIPSPRALQLGDLARIALDIEAGEPLSDDRVEIIGERPGEKRHESLIHRHESVRAVPADVERAWDWALAPAGSAASSEPFEVTSDAPPAGWMPLEEMIELMADAETV